MRRKVRTTVQTGGVDCASEFQSELDRAADRLIRDSARFYVSRFAVNLQSILDASRSDADKLEAIRRLVDNVLPACNHDRAVVGMVCDLVA